MSTVPENISRDDLLKAIAKIDEDGIPARARSSTYDVVYQGNRYPPKLVVSYANIFANGEELDRSTFGAGKNKDSFKLLERNGFTIDTKQDQFDSAYNFLRKQFLKAFPNFTGFKEDKDYIGMERGYKDDLLAFYQRDILPLLDAKEWTQAGEELLKLFTTKLPTDNAAQNIVGWRYFEPIKKLSKVDLAKYASEVAKLINEASPLKQRVDQFLTYFQQLSENNQLNAAATRSIVSFYLTLANPKQYLFLKTQEIARINKRFDPKFSWDTQHIQAYEIEYMSDLAGRVFERLSEEGWDPQDLIDVQSFLWSAENVSNQNKSDSETEAAYELSNKVNMKMDTAINQILYGPPGTGKTYHTVNKALEILDPGFYEANKLDRPTLKRRFDELKARGRIEFVTFHQSFSYEDFVEGLRASTDENGQIRYEIEDGIFKRICDAAAAKVQIESHQTVDVTGRRIWKMSLGNTNSSESYVYDDCLHNEQLLLGYGGHIDFSGANDRKTIVERFLEGGKNLGEHDYAVTAVNTFVNQISPGDLVVVTDGNHKFRAIGEITGDYEYLTDEDHDRDWFWQSRPVKWHRTYSPSLPSDQLMNKVFSQMTLYELRPQSIDMGKLQDLLGGESFSARSARQRPFKEGEIIRGNYTVERVSPELLLIRKPNGSVVPFTWEMLDELVDLVKSGKLKIDDIGKPEIFDDIDTRLEKYIVNGYHNIIPSIINRLIEDNPEAIADEEAQPDAWVLIIDEINRGNVASILGELITLLEPSKRAGAEEALEVALPYSKTKFSVPDNLYIIGTMNTADRSLAHIDTALRRRFQFDAMLPDIGVLNELGIQDVEGIDIQKMLRTLNSRIELLYDKEHTLGHSFFIPLRSDPNLATLSRIFENQIMPLLEEYFFEDWGRIQQVLGDDLKLEADLRFYVPAFEPNEIESLLDGENNQAIHDKAFKRNEQALHRVEAFLGIYEQTAVTG